MTTPHKERPIIFSAPMVRAILDGRKTQTRRAVKPQPEVMYDYPNCPDMLEFLHPVTSGTYSRKSFTQTCPYGQPGDRLWVREKWAPCDSQYIQNTDTATYACFPDGSQKFRNGNYFPWTHPVKNNGWPSGWKWKPSIHMPRWASRITLEITDVRVERLNEISVEDAIAEGVKCPCNFHYCTLCHVTPSQLFTKLWSSIHAADGPNGWDANPWVWVLEFKRIQET